MTPTPPMPLVIRQAIKREELQGAERDSAGVPLRWIKDGKYTRWRCNNGHVASRYRYDRNDPTHQLALCWKCLSRIWATFPEDTETKPPRKRSK